MWLFSISSSVFLFWLIWLTLCLMLRCSQSVNTSASVFVISVRSGCYGKVQLLYSVFCFYKQFTAVTCELCVMRCWQCRDELSSQDSNQGHCRCVFSWILCLQGNFHKTETSEQPGEGNATGRAQHDVCGPIRALPLLSPNGFLWSRWSLDSLITFWNIKICFSVEPKDHCWSDEAFEADCLSLNSSCIVSSRPSDHQQFLISAFVSLQFKHVGALSSWLNEQLV